ncbi:MAG: hypothetical protein J0L97_05815 [Alphaproteobacteria bacterium]|nr:hypothetical protein [Alphaproteobacteria bacterium]
MFPPEEHIDRVLKLSGALGSVGIDDGSLLVGFFATSLINNIKPIVDHLAHAAAAYSDWAYNALGHEQETAARGGAAALPEDWRYNVLNGACNQLRENMGKALIRALFDADAAENHQLQDFTVQQFTVKMLAEFSRMDGEVDVAVTAPYIHKIQSENLDLSPLREQLAQLR